MGSSGHHRWSAREPPDSTSGPAGPHPYYYYKPLPPLPTSDISLEDCSSAALTPASLDSVLARVGQLLSHIPHAICGDAAMAHYGYWDSEDGIHTSMDMPAEVRILCPSYARQVVSGWAAAAGLPIAVAGGDADHSFLAVTVPEDKSARKVRIQWMADEDFRLMGVVSRGNAGMRVVTMPELINDLAGVYVEARARRRGRGDRVSSGSSCGSSSRDREDSVARQILWLLGQIVREGRVSEQMVAEEKAPNVARADFWTPFTFTYPGAAALFYDAGFEPPVEPSNGEEEDEEEVEAARGFEDPDDLLWQTEMDSPWASTDGRPRQSFEDDEEMMRVIRGIEELDAIADSDLWRVEAEKLLLPSTDDGDGIQYPAAQASSDNAEDEEGMSRNSSPDSTTFDSRRAEMESMLALTGERGSDASASSPEVDHSRLTAQPAGPMPRLRRIKGRYFSVEFEDTELESSEQTSGQ